jgi:hypothetical protein
MIQARKIVPTSTPRSSCLKSSSAGLRISPGPDVMQEAAPVEMQVDTLRAGVGIDPGLVQLYREQDELPQGAGTALSIASPAGLPVATRQASSRLSETIAPHHLNSPLAMTPPEIHVGIAMPGPPQRRHGRGACVGRRACPDSAGLMLPSSSIVTELASSRLFSSRTELDR